MKDVNQITLTGRLTRDPELRQTNSGKGVCQMGLAVNESYKTQDGEWQERANFFDVIVWGKQGEACASSLNKGAPITVSGHLSSRSWEAEDGSKRSKIEVVADTVIFHQRKSNDETPF